MREIIGNTPIHSKLGRNLGGNWPSSCQFLLISCHFMDFPLIFSLNLRQQELGRLRFSLVSCGCRTNPPYSDTQTPYREIWRWGHAQYRATKLTQQIHKSSQEHILGGGGVGYGMAGGMELQFFGPWILNFWAWNLVNVALSAECQWLSCKSRLWKIVFGLRKNCHSIRKPIHTPTKCRPMFWTILDACKQFKTFWITLGACCCLLEERALSATTWRPG